jgi:protein-S-isoprenylcysteine O-methyltransferase Ste14
VLGVLVFVLTVFKTATDADSSWASYVGVVLAALVAVGAYLDWAQTRSAESITELEEA